VIASAMHVVAGVPGSGFRADAPAAPGPASASVGTPSTALAGDVVVGPRSHPTANASIAERQDARKSHACARMIEERRKTCARRSAAG
jgi:hypothetical protein